MNHEDERDRTEEEYWRYACPECESDLRYGDHAHEPECQREWDHEVAEWQRAEMFAKGSGQ